jgi:hypothetical protein
MAKTKTTLQRIPLYAIILSLNEFEYISNFSQKLLSEIESLFIFKYNKTK